MQFLNPLMLWGLGAAAVPIVIHLLNRRRYRRQRWAAMEWLLLAAKENQRRFRLESLLLLLLRTAAILLLALALSRPVLSASPLALGGGGAQRIHLFLVVDNSGSSAARSGLRTTLESTTSIAAELLAEIGSDDPVTLVVTNDNLSPDRASGLPRVLVRESRDHDKVRRLLSELRTAPARADLADTLERLDEIVPDVDGREKRIAVVTDMQRATIDRPNIDAGTASSAVDPLRAVLERLKSKGATVVFAPAGRQVDNVGVVALRPEEKRDVVQGQTVAFLAEIVNFSSRPQRVEVRFLVDGEERGDTAAWVELPPRAVGGAAAPARTQRFTVRFEEDDLGSHVVEARISADSFALDDTRSLAFEVRPRLRILAVDGDMYPASATAVAETQFLDAALGLRDEGPISVHVVDDTEFQTMRSLDDWDLVILANVARPAPDEAARQRLETYVRRGGALLLTVGDKTLPDVWNRELWIDGDGLLPAPLDAADVRDEPWLQLDLGENRHPILRDLTDPGNSAFFQSPFFNGFMKLGDVDPARGSSVVMTYTDLNTRPALVERRFGRGRTLLLTTTIDDLWGKLPGSYVGVALLYETVFVVTSHGNSESNLSAFQPFVRTFPSSFGGFEIQYPDGTPARPQVETPPDAPSFVSFTGTDRLGVYRTEMEFRAPDVLTPAPPPDLSLFTVNMSQLESDLQRVELEEIKARYSDLLIVADDVSLTPAAAIAGQTELHVNLLLAALLCLLAEVAVARWIGQRRIQT